MMVIKLIFMVLSALCVNANVLTHNPLYCYSWDRYRPQVGMFGTMTPYDEVRGQTINAQVSSCTPSRIWYQGRHGSRFPAVQDHDNILTPSDTMQADIIDNYKSFRTTLCSADAELINNWELSIDLSGDLTQSGWDELAGISSRLQNAYPSLLPRQYSRDHYFFRHSPIPRTRESAKAVASGLFGSEYESVAYEGGQFPDPFLLSFHSCPAWSSYYHPEAEAFEKTSVYQTMLRQVSAKIGFHGERELNETVVDQLVNHCKYEYLYKRDSPSPFCSAFSLANHQVIEYYRDLEFHTSSGYGNRANRRLYENMSCNLLQSMLQFLQSNDPNEQKAKFWLGHDVTLQFLFVALGLYEDAVPLTASNFAEQTNRKWKTTEITPMAANLAVIRYDCADGDNDLLFLHNENPLQIPGCNPNGLCKQSYLMQRYSRYLNANCDAIFCTNN